MGRAWVISGGRDSGERSTASPATDATTLLYLLAVVLVAGDGRKLCETKPHCRTHGCGNLTRSFLTGSHLQTGNSKIQLTARCRTRPLRREKRSLYSAFLTRWLLSCGLHCRSWSMQQQPPNAPERCAFPCRLADENEENGQRWNFGASLIGCGTCSAADGESREGDSGSILSVESRAHESTGATSTSRVVYVRLRRVPRGERRRRNAAYQQFMVCRKVRARNNNK